MLTHTALIHSACMEMWLCFLYARYITESKYKPLRTRRKPGMLPSGKLQ